MDYKKIHDNIINKARSENRVKGKGDYYEAHHIIPICMGGEGHVSQFKTHPNIILLTAREHFVIHKLLCEIYPDNDKLKFALFVFVNGKNKNNHKGNKYYNIGSREYERIRIECSKASKKHFTEIERTTEWGNNISKSKKGKPGHKQTEEWKLNHSKRISGENHPFFEKTHKEESKIKMSKSKIGKKPHNAGLYINPEMGIFWDIDEVKMLYSDISRSAIWRRMNGKTKSKINLVLA